MGGCGVSGGGGGAWTMPVLGTLVVVVKAEPIFTLRRFCPSDARETMAGAAKEAAAVARSLRRNMCESP